MLSPNLFNSLIMWVGATAVLYVLLTLAWQRADIARRALRAAIILTASDIALTLGVLFTWIKFGVFSSLLAAPAGQSIADPFSFSVISQGVIATLHHGVASTGPRALLVMGIVFLVAAAVRSAQFPFTVWLRDAASSAIPVLALAGATVAPLGLYLVARIYPVVAHTPRALPVFALVGGLSAVVSAATGIAQRSITRIAVCAVASELSLAVVALGMGGYSPGVFIAFTSIFTSTLLFLAVANLVRVYRTDDIGEMGGAWVKLRTTSVALGAWALLAGGVGLSCYYALSSGLNGVDPAGGVFSVLERVVIVIVTAVAGVLVAVLAARLLLTVTTGEVSRRRGFQHDRVAEVEGALRRPLRLVLIAAVVAVLVGLPGLQPFTLGSARIAGLTFMRFVFYASHHQSIGLDGIAALLALLVAGRRFRRGIPPVRPGPPGCAAAGARGMADTHCGAGLLRRATDGDRGAAPARRRRPRVRLRRAGHRARRSIGGRERRLRRVGTRGSSERPVLAVPRRRCGCRRDSRAAFGACRDRPPLGAPGMSVILSTIVWSPLLFAVIALFLPERNDEERARVRTVALAGAGVSFFVTTFFAILGQIGLGQGGGLASAYQENHTWFWNFLFQAHYDLVADGISLPLLVVVTTIFGCAMFHSWKIHERVRLYVILVLLVETAVNGVLCSSDFVLFVAFWAMLLVPMYLLIRIWGGEGARRAAAWFAGFQAVSLALIIATVVIIVVEAGAQSSDMTADLTTFSVTAETVGFWLSFTAFAIAMAIFPVHTWMLEAQTKASAGVATILSGTMLLLGAYGMMRISLVVFPAAAHYYGFAITGLAVVGAFWGSVGALRQDELRRFIGYMNVAQMSLVLLAIGAQTSVALVGAVLLLCGQGLGSAMLTLVSGAIEERTRTTSIRAMGGLVTQAPRLAGFWLVAAASVIGIPFLAGFTGDFMVFAGSFPEHRIATVLVMASVIVITGGLLWVANRVFFGPVRDQFARVRDVTLLDLTVLIPLVAAVLLFGLRAGAVIPVIANGVLEITTRITGA